MCKDRLFMSIAIIVFILLVEERCRGQWGDECEDSHECDDMRWGNDRGCGCDSDRDHDHDDSCGCEEYLGHGHDAGCGCEEHPGRGRRNGRGSSLPMAHDPFSGRR